MRLSASISFMFRERPILERFAAARAAGFAGVEIQRLAEGVPDEMAWAAREAGVEVALINVPSGDFAEGGDGLSGVPGREEAFRESLEHAIETARALGTQHVHIGPSRVPAGVDRGECLAVFASNARLALSISRATGIILLVEPMNPVDSPTALFSRIDAAAAAVQELAHPRLRLQFDVYHVAMGGDDVLGAWRRHRAIVEHVQFSDPPARHEPGAGDGRIDVLASIAAMRDDGYDGWFGAEYFPSTVTEETLGWMQRLERKVTA